MSNIKPGWKGMVKVQQSLNYKGDILIYNADRSIMHQDEGNKELLGFMGDRHKVYCWATIDKDMKIIVDIETAVDQNQAW